jgi:hypothetical protein
MKQNLNRNIALTFRVSGEEQALIRKGMEIAGISNLRAYLLKMAVDGRIISVEMDSIVECNRLLRNISSNINQVAKKVNMTDRVTGADIDWIKAQQAEIWAKQDNIINKLTKIMEAV